MMIEWEGYGDLMQAQGHIKVCPINAVGTMGKGLALTVRKTYPEVNELYLSIYHPDQSAVADIYYRARQLTLCPCNNNDRILLLCTKYDWRDNSDLQLIEDNLIQIANQACYYDKIAMPLLGTGLGGLDRDSVYELTHEIMDETAIDVSLYLGMA